MRRRTRWAALLLVNTAACAPGRGTTRTTVIGDGVAGSTTELAGEPWRAGGGLGVRHKRGSGAVVGAQVRVVDSPAIWGATFLAGSHSDTVGFEASLSGVHAASSVGWVPIPSLRVLVGEPHVFWFELEAGSQDPLFYLGLASAGVAVEAETFRLRVGLSMYGVLVDEAETGLDLHFPAADPSLNGGVYLEGLAHLGQVGVVGGLIVGPATLARLGLALDFD